LVSLSRLREWGPAEWARGSYVGVRLLAFGAAGVPYLRGRFSEAEMPDEALLAATYVAVHGAEEDRRFIRRSLESDAGKRRWLVRLAGDGRRLANAMREGQRWAPAVRWLPSLDGIRRTILLCVRSEDALVRRSALYWGFWVADDAVWTAIRCCADTDPDLVTRGFARYLRAMQP
jgi:hypothetical protein